MTLPDGAQRRFRARNSGVLTGTASGERGDPLRATGPEERVAVTIDARGNRTTRLFNDAGHLTKRVDAIGRTTRTERDEEGNPVETIRANDSVVNRTFGEQGNLLTTTEQFNDATTERTYDEHGFVTSITDPRGNTTTIERDADGNPVKRVNALGHTVTMEYNGRGRLVRRGGRTGW